MKGKIKETLRNFGLTEKETDVYIFLGKHGPLKSSEITKQLKMNKGQVYRTLKSLQKKGIAEITLEHPTRFTVIPFEKVIDSFIKSKIEEVAVIKETKKDLLSDWKKIKQTELETSLEKFSVIEGNKKIFNKIFEMIKETKHQFSIALTLTDLFNTIKFGIFDFLNIYPKQSKVKFHFLTDFSIEYLKSIENLINKSKSKFDIRGKNPNFSSPLLPRIAIRDDEEILLFISDSNNQSDSQSNEVCLVTNCKCIIQSFSSVFKDSWSKSINLEEKIDEIITGKTIPKMDLIRDPKAVKKIYYNTLNLAKKEILIVTSPRRLKGLSNNINLLKKWSNNGVTIRILAPIMSENLKATHKLLEICEIRHIPVGYTEMTIIDDQYLFQFNTPTPDDNKNSEVLNLGNVFFTNNTNYVKQTKNMLFDIWRKTRSPSSENLRSISGLQTIQPVSGREFHIPFIKTSYQSQTESHKIEKMTEQIVLDKIEKEKTRSIRNNLNRSDTLRYFGKRAFAVIHPLNKFALPDMLIGVFKNDEDSSFGASNWMIVNISQKTNKGLFYIPVAYIQDTPENLDLKKELFAGFPVENNIMVFGKDEFQVRVKGNTLFAGWTKPIPLVYKKYILPPSCLLFEGYGDVKPGMFTNVNSLGRGQEIWYNSFDAFVSFFHPQSKYVGSGTEGLIEREHMLISNPSIT